VTFIVDALLSNNPNLQFIMLLLNGFQICNGLLSFILIKLKY